MRTLLFTLATCAALLLPGSIAWADGAEAPADELLLEISAVDRGFTPVGPEIGEADLVDFEFLATNECTTAGDCPCPNLCFCVSPGTSPDTYCLCRLSCCTTPNCA